MATAYLAKANAAVASGETETPAVTESVVGAGSGAGRQSDAERLRAYVNTLPSEYGISEFPEDVLQLLERTKVYTRTQDLEIPFALKQVTVKIVIDCALALDRARQRKGQTDCVETAGIQYAKLEGLITEADTIWKNTQGEAETPWADVSGKALAKLRQVCEAQ